MNLWRGDKRFWSPIAIGSGLTIFFFGISTVTNDLARGWFTIGFGLLLLALGFATAPMRESKSRISPEQSGKEPKDYGNNEAKSTEAEYQMYREERKALQDALLDQSRSYDKFILTLAAGAFGLSFLFIQQFAPEPRPGTITFLVFAWVSFAVSILTTLLSFLLSQKACLTQIMILDRWLAHGSQRKQEPINVYTTITQWLNWVSMVVFLTGVVLLIIFGAQNVSP